MLPKHSCYQSPLRLADSFSDPVRDGRRAASIGYKSQAMSATLYQPLSYCHRGGQTPLFGMPIPHFLATVFERHADREAVVSLHQKIRWTYRDLDQQVRRAAKGLTGLGVQRGDRVGIWSTNNVEWLLLQLATAQVGAILVNVNPANRTQELQHALNRAQVQWLFLIPEFRTSHYLQRLLKVCPEADSATPGTWQCSAVPSLRGAVLYDPVDASLTETTSAGILTWPEFLKNGEEISNEILSERIAELDADDPINIQFTSGTTGFPKAVTLTHHNILNNAYFVAEQMQFTENDRLCVPVPFYHCFGMVVSNLGTLTHGGTLVLPGEHFDPESTLQAVASERCTALHGVPSMFIAELSHPRFSGFDCTSLRTGIMAGAPCPPELMRSVIDDMGCRHLFLIGYGMTEASPVTHSTHIDDPWELRVESVGHNLPHQEVKVIDPNSGAIVPIGTQGEVCMRGYHIMRGYYGDAPATAEAIDRGGWLHSGDLGVMNADGTLKITGRLKDMIVRGGENIYPAEIERVIFEHPAVEEVAVFGVPDEKFGEELAAWIRLHQHASLQPEELRETLRQSLAHYKVPRYLWFVDEFPQTVSGKIQKFVIRDQVAKWLADHPADAALTPPWARVSN